VALREAVLVRDPRADAPGGPHDDALACLAARSLPLRALAAHDARLRGGLWDALVAGRPYETGRIDCVTFAAFVHWCLDTDRLARDPLCNFSKVPRDPDTEIVDPERVPDAPELDVVGVRPDRRRNVASRSGGAGTPVDDPVAHQLLEPVVGAAEGVAEVVAPHRTVGARAAGRQGVVTRHRERELG